MNKSHLVTTAIALAMTAGIVKADVLYDTTGMSKKGTWDESYGNFIGGAIFFGDDIDSQAADNFELDGTYGITIVTADYGTTSALPPVDGVLVEIFEDLGGFPSEVPIAQVLSAEFVATQIDIHPVIDGLRLTVDLSNEGITLAPGTWWVAITPVDTAPLGGEIYNQLASTAGTYGNSTHRRDGGEDHGNGLPGFTGENDWILAGLLGGNEYADLAMRIEGTLVGEPCPADLDGSGAVNTSDLLELFAAWGKNPGSPADLDGDGTVSTSDLLILFANWGPCP
ncbi:MAG: hypothetical protein IH984_00025 [Planctomycetes bacterium]|nr:hypothetical protein [Planctomycetota bacterium]